MNMHPIRESSDQLITALRQMTVECVFRSKSARHSDFMSATDSEVKSAIPI
jgi:hypothetical protein